MEGVSVEPVRSFEEIFITQSSLTQIRKLKPKDKASFEFSTYKHKQFNIALKPRDSESHQLELPVSVGRILKAKLEKARVENADSPRRSGRARSGKSALELLGKKVGGADIKDSSQCRKLCVTALDIVSSDQTSDFKDVRSSAKREPHTKAVANRKSNEEVTYDGGKVTSEEVTHEGAKVTSEEVTHDGRKVTSEEVTHDGRKVTSEEVTHEGGKVTSVHGNVMLTGGEDGKSEDSREEDCNVAQSTAPSSSVTENAEISGESTENDVNLGESPQCQTNSSNLVQVTDNSSWSVSPGERSASSDIEHVKPSEQVAKSAEHPDHISGNVNKNNGVTDRVPLKIENSNVQLQDTGTESECEESKEDVGPGIKAIHTKSEEGGTQNSNFNGKGIQDVLSKLSGNFSSGKVIEIHKVVNGKVQKIFMVTPKESKKVSSVAVKSSDATDARQSAGEVVRTEVSASESPSQPNQAAISSGASVVQPQVSAVSSGANQPIPVAKTDEPVKTPGSILHLKPMPTSEFKNVKDHIESGQVRRDSTTPKKPQVLLIKKEGAKGETPRLVAYPVGKDSTQGARPVKIMMQRPAEPENLGVQTREDQKQTRAVDESEKAVAVKPSPEPVTRLNVMHLRKQLKGNLATLLKKKVEPITSEDLEKEDPGHEGRVQFLIQPEFEALLENLECDDGMEDHVVPWPSSQEADDTGVSRKRACAKCKYCDHVVLNRHDFRKHIRVHTEVEHKPWKCPLCDYRAQIKATIRKHINIHSEVKAYRCSDCGKGFNFRQKLQLHMKYHRDIRDFYCPQCPLSFHELKTLKNHLCKLHAVPNPAKFLKHSNYRQPSPQHLSYKRQQKALNYQNVSARRKSVRVRPVSYMDYAEAPSYGHIVNTSDAHILNADVEQVVTVGGGDPQSKGSVIIGGGGDGVGHGSVVSALPDQAEGQTMEYAQSLNDEVYEITVCGESTEQQGQYSSQQGQYAPGQGQYAPEQGQYAPEQGHYASEQGQYASEQGQYASEQGQYASEQGQYASEQGQYASELGQYAPEQGQYASEQGQYAPEQGQYAPTQESPYQVQEEYQEALPDTKFVVRDTEEQPQTLIVDTEKGPVSVQMYRGIQANSAQLMAGGQLVEEAVPDSVQEAVEALRSIKQEPADATEREHSAESMPKGVQWSYLQVEYQDSKEKGDVALGMEGTVELGTHMDDAGANPVLNAVQFEGEREVTSERLDDKTTIIKIEPPRRSKLVGTKKIDSKTLKFKQGIVEEETPKAKKRPSESDELGTNSKMKKVTCIEMVELGVRPYVRLTHFSSQMSDYDVSFVCRLCEDGAERITRAFDLYTKFLSHLFSDHPSIKPFVCSQCSYSCRSKANLISHSKIHEGNKKFVCKICGKSFLFRQKLKVHVRVHENRREHVCSLCMHGFNEKSDLNRHFRKVHMKERSVSCSECGKRFFDQTDLKRHLESHSVSKLYECTYCHKFYQTKVSLSQHVKSHTCIFHCEICSRDFGSYSGFMAHKVMHDESSEGYLCEYCDKKIMTKGSMKRHMLICHSDDRPYQCSDCGKGFKSKKDLKSHYLIHESERVYVCEVCSFSSKRLETLRVHMRTHQAVKPFQCGVCSKQYTQKHALEQHMAVHIEKRFSCDICRRHFATAEQMNKHMLSTHLPSELREQVLQSGSMTVYMCEECHSVFVSQDALAVHILEEHMAKTDSQPKAERESLLIRKVEESSTKTIAVESREQYNIVPLGVSHSDVTMAEGVMDDVTVKSDGDREENEVECEIVTDTPELTNDELVTPADSLATRGGSLAAPSPSLAADSSALAAADPIASHGNDMETGHVGECDEETSRVFQPVLTTLLKQGVRDTVAMDASDLATDTT